MSPLPAVAPAPSRARLEPARRRLEAARLAGTGVVAVFGQLALDRPFDWLGATGATTLARSGLPLAVGVLVAAGTLALLRPATAAASRAQRFGQVAPHLLLALVLGVFLPALSEDPRIAGGVVLWAIAHLSRLLFPLPATPPPPAADPLAAWLERNGKAVGHLLRVSLVVTTAALGYRIGGWQARLLCLLWGAVAVAAAMPALERMAAAGRRRVGLPAALAVAALLAAARPTLALGLFAAAQLAVLLLLLADRPLARELADAFARRPAWLLVGSFAILIIAGALFLSFPASAADGRGIAPIDALFTATSAVCVTGLIVLDTPHAFSPFGHGVLLVLIQVGGLNIMVLSAFAAIALGRSLGLRAEQALAEVLDLERTRSRSAYALIAFVVTVTIACEAIGALVLAASYAGRGEPALEALWLGVFHSVSAFCNAGFALHSDSLIGFREAPLVLLTVAALIVAGGLGFPALAAAGRLLRGRRTAGLHVQVRLVLGVTAALVVGGTAAIAALEWDRALAGLATSDKLVNALFQSVTLRTAGFNSVSFDALHPATILLMIVFMLVGASPGGTGGGIKTTTAAVLLSAISAIARGEPRVVLFGWRLPLETVYRAAAITVVSVLAVLAGSTLLLVFEPHELVSALFEAASAVGTVGLSLGATAKLGLVGKCGIGFLMFLGRVGPLTLALLLARPGRGRLGYPEARVMVG